MRTQWIFQILFGRNILSIFALEGVVVGPPVIVVRHSLVTVNVLAMATEEGKGVALVRMVMLVVRMVVVMVGDALDQSGIGE